MNSSGMAPRLLGDSMVLGGLGVWACGLPEAAYNAYMLVGFPLLAALLAGRGPARVPELCMALTASGLALIACDVALRVRLADSGHLFPSVGYLDRHPPFARVGRFGRELVAEGSVYGNLASQGTDADRRSLRRVTYRTDRHGFRNAPEAAERSADVLVLGDSFAEGAAIEQERRWVDLLETRFGRRPYTLGIPGASPWGALMNLKLELGRLRFPPGTPLIWMLYAGNDLDELYYPELDPVPAGPARQAWVRFQSFRRRSPVRWLAERLALAWGLAEREVAPVRWDIGSQAGVLFSGPQLTAVRRGAPEVLAHPHYPDLARVLEETVRTAREAGLVPHLVLAPAKEQVYAWALPGETGLDALAAGSGFAQVIADHAAKLGVPFLDLGPAFVRVGRELVEGDGSLLYFGDDTHWNEAGNALAAELVAPLLTGPGGPG